MPTRSTHSSLIFIPLIILFTLKSTAIMVYLPALPSIATSFHMSRAWAQTTVSFYLTGVVLSSIIGGVLSCKLSKRQLLRYLFILYIAACILCAAANTAWLYFVAIVLQGTGSGCLLALAQSTLADIQKGPKLAKRIAQLGFFTTLSIGASAWIGGILVHHYDWRYSFIFLAIYAIVAFPTLFLLPNSKSVAAKNTSIMQHYRESLSNPTFIKYTLTLAFIGAGSAIFRAVSPFIIIHELHLSAKFFGLLMFIPTFGLMLGRLFCMFCSHYSRHAIISFGIGISALSAVGLLFHFQTPIIQAIFVMSCGGGYMVGLGLVSPNARAAALDTIMVTSIAATLISFFYNVLSTIHTFLVSHYLESFLGESLLFVCICAGLLYLKGHVLVRKK